MMKMGSLFGIRPVFDVQVAQWDVPKVSMPASLNAAAQTN